MARPKLAPIHPGEVLAPDFLEPLSISQYRLAKNVSVPARRINEIVHHTRAVSADTALRLARYFGTSDRFLLNLQARYDLEWSGIILAPDSKRKCEFWPALADIHCSSPSMR